ncbi:MAG: hypothetical protein AB1424_13400 [Thermodesulfobacteriota bacterium]
MWVEEGFQGTFKKVIDWIKHFIISESAKRLIAFLIPTSLLPALTERIINPAKPFLAMALVTAPLTITIAFLVIMYIDQDEKSKFDIREIIGFVLIYSIPAFLILFSLNWLIGVIGLAPPIKMHSPYWNPITAFIVVAKKYLPNIVIFLLSHLPFVLITLCFLALEALYDMVASFIEVYRWTLLFSLVVGVIAGWIGNLLIESFRNSPFIKIKGLMEVYSYSELKKKGRLAAKIEDRAITLAFHKKDGSVSVKDQKGQEIPFYLVRWKERNDFWDDGRLVNQYLILDPGYILAQKIRKS